MYIEGEIPNVVTSNGCCNNNGNGSFMSGLATLFLLQKIFKKFQKNC